ncbi:MAG TPA: amidohydrolase family protein [Casimicrobiaceae bacterium]|nr:amidohydrolase family protein [Casimicrobiaceae bacterium]
MNSSIISVSAATSPLPFAIVDAHQHFWDPKAHYYPWLNDEPPIAFRYGDYRAIRRRYLPSDFLADAAPFWVDKSVYVEAEWDPRDPVGEMRYIERLRHDTGWPSVAVAQAWLDRDDAASVLERQAAFGFVRSVRHKPRANPSPNDGAPGGTTDEAWRAGFAKLARLGLRFDLQTPWWHLHEAARLATDFPDTTIIVNHAGLPADRSAEGVAGWKKAMARVAACPNVAVKISGIGQRDTPWTTDANRGIVRTVIDLFDVDRCMFASNFPVDSLCASYAEIFGGFRDIVADLPIASQRALFRDNALRVYAIA